MERLDSPLPRGKKTEGFLRQLMAWGLLVCTASDRPQWEPGPRSAPRGSHLVTYAGTLLLRAGLSLSCCSCDPTTRFRVGLHKCLFTRGLYQNPASQQLKELSVCGGRLLRETSKPSCPPKQVAAPLPWARMGDC